MGYADIIPALVSVFEHVCSYAMRDKSSRRNMPALKDYERLGYQIVLGYVQLSQCSLFQLGILLGIILIITRVEYCLFHNKGNE